MMRFRRSTRESEGRVEEVWVIVDDEDELEDWGTDTELNVVGHPAPRIGAAQRVSGAATFTVDIDLPAMLHAAVLRSPLACGRVRALDVDGARNARGVSAAIGPTHEHRRYRGQLVLTAEPEHAGSAIAAVAADTPEQATAALEAFRMELEPLPFLIDPEVAVADEKLTKPAEKVVRGDPDRAITEAKVGVSLAIATPHHLQTALEPHAAVAHWSDDELTVWVSTQGMFKARDELAEFFGIPRNRVRVICEYVGGGFGGKQGAGGEAVLAAILARLTGRPVRLVNDRHTEQLVAGRRGATLQSITLAASLDGELAAVDAEAVVSMGLGGWVEPVMAPAATLYRCENVRTTTLPARVNLLPQNSFRAPGVMEGTAVFEQAVDELAGALAMDPLDVRCRWFVDHDQKTGKPYSSKHLLECYQRAAEQAGWADRDRLREPMPDGLLRGMGCATQIWWGSGGPPAHATIRVDADGCALVVTGMQDIGTGALTTAQLVAAEELGLPPDCVRVVGGDTGPSVYGPTAEGSMTTPSVLPAVRSAAGKVRRKLLRLAGDLFEVDPDDLILRNGRLGVVGGGLDKAVTDITARLGDATIDGSGSRGPNSDGAAVHTFGCQIALVAVDPLSGGVSVERVWAVHDVGRIVNPLTATSQVEGGIIQGIGFALYEDCVVDPTTGTPLTATLEEYKLPTIADVPEIHVEFIDVADPAIPHIGAKGLGEPPIIPTAAAIANAFVAATGRRCTALPMTRQRVLEALR